MIHPPNSFHLQRYPSTTNRSLKAWNASDEYMIDYLRSIQLPRTENLVIYNDHFGYLSLHLSDVEPSIVITKKSQEFAIRENAAKLSVDLKETQFKSPLESFDSEVNLAVIRLPKSMELFKHFLHQLSFSLTKDAIVVAGFMTRHFNKSMISIAEQYFEEAEQSLARKKSRLLIMKHPKKTITEFPVINNIPYTFPAGEQTEIKQYTGVFSSKRIYVATDLLIQHLNIQDDDMKILDLASGNGVIASAVQYQKPEATIHLMDDSVLAVESSKMNLRNGEVYFHTTPSLTDINEKNFDLIVSNPPFHFEHENTIEITLRLFNEVHAALKAAGRFVLVANTHLNYSTHLKRIFNSVHQIASSNKYEIIQAVK